MSTQQDVWFDHIEVHVKDIPRYAQFLEDAFAGGRSKVISENGTMMFISPEGMNIEIKKMNHGEESSDGGFCLPCIRTANARIFVEGVLQLAIERTITNPEGEVHFFRDHEGIQWHVKDYTHRDRYIDW